MVHAHFANVAAGPLAPPSLCFVPTTDSKRRPGLREVPPTDAPRGSCKGLSEPMLGRLRSAKAQAVVGWSGLHRAKLTRPTELARQLACGDCSADVRLHAMEPYEALVNHAHVLITEGQDSYRLAQATAGKGVKPLT